MLFCLFQAITSLENLVFFPSFLSTLWNAQSYEVKSDSKAYSLHSIFRERYSRAINVMIIYSLTRISPLCLGLLLSVALALHEKSPFSSPHLSAHFYHLHRCPVHSAPLPVSPLYQLQYLLRRPYPYFHRIASLPYQSPSRLLFLLLHQTLVKQKQYFSRLP